MLPMSLSVIFTVVFLFLLLAFTATMLRRLDMSKGLVVLTTGLASPVLFIVAIITSDLAINELEAQATLPGSRFDAELWRATRPESLNDLTRTRMVANLLRSHEFVGWKKQEVLSLLGPPTSDHSHGQTPESKRTNLTYLVGPERSFISIDSEWLTFSLDANDIVVSTYVWID